MTEALCRFFFSEAAGCTYCGNAIGWLRRRSDADFCSDDHRARYHELLRLGLGRLLGSHDAQQHLRAAVPAGPAPLPRLAGLLPRITTRERPGWRAA